MEQTEARLVQVAAEAKQKQDQLQELKCKVRPMFVNAIMFCCLPLSLFVLKIYLSLCCIASYDALRLILFYTTHQYRIYLHICHFELVYTRTNVWNQFPLFRGCGVRPQFTFCVYSNLSISSWPESQTETSQQHSLLVLTPAPQLLWFHLSALSMCARRAFHLNAHVSTERKSSSSDTLLRTSHFLLSCALITNV